LRLFAAELGESLIAAPRLPVLHRFAYGDIRPGAGASHGSWCWKWVRKSLQRAGHDVFTPTPTGVGERCHLASPDVNSSTHSADVLNLIHWEELSKIILCGHSYGGFVISGVADRIPERICALVYVDAFVPEDGERVFDLVSPEMAFGLRQQAAASGDRWKVNLFPAKSLKLTWPTGLG
jgi:pimeloyl-ACP methyl ester carboxylesterase